MSDLVLVTGGAGFIGSHTVDALLKSGYVVRILDNLSKPVHLNGKPDYIPSEVEFIEGDVRNRADWEKALDNVDMVFHLAAYQDYLPDFSTFFHVNSVGTALLYEVIVEKKLPVRKVIVASSQAVYGEGLYECDEHGRFIPDSRSLEKLESGDWDHRCPKCHRVLRRLPTPETVTNPQNQYALSKATQEMMAMNFGRRYGIPSVTLRYSIVQGPRQSFYNAYSGVCRIFCLHLYFDRQPTAYEDGKSLRDYVNIDDVIAANMLVLEDDSANGQIFNVGGGKGYTVAEFGRIVAKVYGKPILPKVTGEFRYGDTRHVISDISKLRALGWKPRYTPEKSARDYVTWLSEQADVRDILDYAQRTMKQLNVVRRTRLVI